MELIAAKGNLCLQHAKRKMEIIEIKNEESKYAQGRLHITFFKDGNIKHKTIVFESDNFIKAMEYAETEIYNGKYESFTIQRIIYNSMRKKHEV